MTDFLSKKTFQRTIEDLEKLADSEFVRGKTLNDFSVAYLKKLKSEDSRHLCKKKIEELSNKILKTRENLPNEEESVKFITDKYKQFFFNSKWAQRLDYFNNLMTAGS